MMEVLAPHEVSDRMLTAEPSVTKLNTLHSAPKRPIWRTEKDDPTCMNCITLTRIRLAPALSSPLTLMQLPRRTDPRTLMELEMVMKDPSERAELQRAQERILSEEPKVSESKMLILLDTTKDCEAQYGPVDRLPEMTHFRCDAEMDRPEPQRMKLRIDSDEPMDTKLSMLKLPILAKPLSDILEPIAQKSKTLARMPMLAFCFTLKFDFISTAP
jgi:hypothetical protein